MKISRRAMIVSGVAVGGGLAVAYGLSRFDDGDARAKFAATTPDQFVVNAYVKIARDGRITIAMPMAELGQGVATAAPMLVAEELDAKWEDVGFELAPLDKEYGSYMIAEAVPVIFMKPGMMADAVRWALYQATPYIGLVLTAGSTAIFGNYTNLRTVGAIARDMLKTAAAAQWDVDVAELKTASSRVVHEKSGRSATYGELAESAARLTPPSKAELKDPASFSIVGQSKPRLDTPSKVDGSARYGIDLRLPNMLYAAIRHAPVFGATVGKFDAAKAKQAKGVVDVVKAGEGCVAVVAESTWIAERAARALDVTFTPPATTESTPALAASYREQFDAPDRAVQHTAGDAAAAFAGAARTVEAVYETPHLAHVCMEPMNATALYEPAASGKAEEARVTVWSPSQSVSMSQRAAVQAAGVPSANVTIHNSLMGGGFGRRAEMDYVLQAVRIAMQVPGRPVKLTWSREEDLRNDAYRPASAARFRGALDAAGNLAAIDFAIVAKSVTVDFGKRNSADFGREARDDKSLVGPMNVGPYAIPHMTLAYQPHDNLIPVGNWRSVANSHNGFYQESFVDELAVAAGQDLVDFRRTLLKDKPAHLAVLNLAAEKAGWGTALAQGEGRRGRGIAMLDVFGTTIAQVVEVTVAADNTIKVDRVVSVVDSHTIVNPGIIAAQIESAVIDGLSSALYGKIDVENGAVVNGNFDSYRMMTMADAPGSIETHIAPSGGHPGGIGEVGLPCIAPALCSAIFAATGTRVRSLPVMEALGVSRPKTS